MEAMCQTPRERKSKSLDKIKKEYKERKNEKRTCGKEEGGRKFPTLIKLDDIRWERRKKEEKKKKENKRKKESEVRSSTLSLRSMEIGSSVFVGARGKVHLGDESFA